MDKRVLIAPIQDSGQRSTLNSDTISAILLETALDAFVKSILVTTFGSIAIEFAEGIWQEMAPSAPPGFTGKPEAEVTSSGALNSWVPSFNEHQFLMLFGVMFVLMLWSRLGNRNEKESQIKSRVRRIGDQLSEQWFSLIVGNAIGAMISAVVVASVQFTLSKMLLGWLLESLVAGVQNVVQNLFGVGKWNAFGAWFDWYGENQFEFTFWLFYLAAICDDLGIPNLKTLGRWLIRRVRNRMKQKRTAISRIGG